MPEPMPEPLPLRFVVEQVALAPALPSRAMILLQDLGLTDWAHDHVVAEGFVNGVHTKNEADLAFNYQATPDVRELEVLHYTDGMNWLKSMNRINSVCHLGMHVTAEELERWREFFSERRINVAQEVLTQSHTNPVIAGHRTYEYVVFNTKSHIGVDLKFIVRNDVEEE